MRSGPPGLEHEHPRRRVLGQPRRERAARRAAADDHVVPGHAEHDRLQLGEGLERRRASDAADAARAAGAAAERQVRLPVVRRLVDVDPAGSHLVGVAQALRQVAGEDRRQEPVRRRVRELDRVLERVDRDDGRDRPERLLGGDERVGRDAVEDGRLPVQVGREAARARAAVHDLGSALGPRRRRARPSSPRRLRCSAAPSSSSRRTGRRAGRARRRAARASPTNSSRTSRCTSSRSPAVQLCPAQRKHAATVASAARSRSASSRTTTGPLPPSSSTAALPAAASATRRPVSVEPMKPTPCVPGLRAISSPTTAPGPVTKLKTPGGRSASATHSASAIPATAVVEAGVQTTVLPAASAGAISSAGIVYGQFQGVMTPITPRGRRTSSTRLPLETEFGIRPSSRLPSSAALRQYCDELLDLVARLGERLALVERQRVRERVAPLLDRRRRRGADRRRARTRSGAPSRRGPVRRRDRALRVLAPALLAPRRSSRRWRATRPSNVSPD